MRSESMIQLTLASTRVRNEGWNETMVPALQHSLLLLGGGLCALLCCFLGGLLAALLCKQIENTILQ